MATNGGRIFPRVAIQVLSLSKASQRNLSFKTGLSTGEVSSRRSPTHASTLVRNTRAYFSGTTPKESAEIPVAAAAVGISTTRKLAKWILRLAGVAALGVGGFYAYEYGDYQLNAPPAGYKRPRLVILGTGWGAFSILKDLDLRYYDVTVVSPRNYFLFTPLLPCVAVGTLEPRSIMQEIRAIFSHGVSAEGRPQYFDAECIDADITSKTIRCRNLLADPGAVDEFTLPYDILVVSVGAKNNTFGVKGVKENCHFLKEVKDARTLRGRFIECFESANMDGQTEEERQRLLRFVIVGGGPTGVEISAELSDFINGELSQMFPHLMKYAKVTIIQSGDHILNTFSKAISEYAEQTFKRDEVEVLTNQRVIEIRPREIVVQPKKASEPFTIKFSVCVWATGIGPVPLTEKLATAISGQGHRKALVSDEYLKVKGAHGVFALGDCATVERSKLKEKAEEIFKEHDTSGDGNLQLEEFGALVKTIKERMPVEDVFTNVLGADFKKIDKDNDGQISFEEFQSLVKAVDAKLTSYPATAQVAHQQGRYLARVLTHSARTLAATAAGDRVELAKRIVDHKPEIFAYNHMGFAAYIGGDKAVLDLPAAALSGYGAWLLWKSSSLQEQVSMRNRVSIVIDTVRNFLFGRDASRV